MISREESDLTAVFLHKLQKKDGGYGAGPSDSASSLQSTLSVIKTLRMLNEQPSDPGAVIAFVKSCFDGKTGGFSEHPSGIPSALSTSRALIILHALEAQGSQGDYLQAGILFMSKNAKNAVDHFMTIAAWSECEAPGPAPEVSVDFFLGLRQENGFFGESVLENGIAFASLLRAGVYVKNQKPLIKELLDSKADGGGFSNSGGPVDLMTTYVVMRTFFLLNLNYDPAPVVAFIAGLRNSDGGYAPKPDTSSDGNITYMFISILEWADGLYNHQAVEEARSGETDMLKKRLCEGWDPNGPDPEGWTALLAAASRGEAEVVELLLFHTIEGAKHADPEIRFAPADGLPVFMAGQKGDVRTVKLLLKANPEHMFEISRVNGHTVLLQAAFYGLEPHRELAKYLLDNAGDILSIPPGDLKKRKEAVKKLTTATYVRGLNALDIAAFWKNKPMQELLESYPQPSETEKKAYFDTLKKKIAPPPPVGESEREKQQLTEEMMTLILDGLKKCAEIPDSEVKKCELAKKSIFDSLKDTVAKSGFQINRLGSFLMETPVIMALTGHDANHNVSVFREELVRFLLDHGADPDKPELHPMGVDAVIRSAVLHHFEVLKIIAEYMRPEAFTGALNTKPGVNGQTALYDTAHQTLKADKESLPGYIKQVSWCIAHGADPDIAEFTGKTIKDLAREASEDPATQNNAAALLKELEKVNY